MFQCLFKLLLQSKAIFNCNANKNCKILAKIITMKNIHLKIKYLREQKSLTQQDFALKIGVSRSTLSQIEIAKITPTLEVVQKIASVFSISFDWLLSEDETEAILTYKEPSVPTEYQKDISKTQALQALESEGLRGIKVYISPEPAMASYPTHYITEEEEPHLEWFFMPFLRHKGIYAAFPVVGQSMQGCVNNGSWVICRLLEQNYQIRSGNIHLIATKTEGLVLKRVEINSKLKKGIICYSDNHIYGPFILPYDEIVKVWAVEACLEQSFVFSSEKATIKLQEFIDEINANL
ncbi:hypothetical protein AD998_18585 [bacterium 336/3]|nr:hypothetical protein AD998_18585 [bacterium 336/3]